MRLVQHVISPSAPTLRLYT